ncbi:MAG: DUF3326 domain-containing protein [Microcoleus sp. PH2017_10_PVI_O_A]|uniref:DUF3326 domain-containing protein n=1 Tax=unclassified Microcoleus TaxID=2642155 RepID=UPI001D65367E|nr:MULTISPECIES: DUF3326 domain-containing protein [unclassified Microcoleus]TAE83733.1 MAG: DUF3326 domain-containing protein [Oscillatoriales cyanobacterium]MCC3405927.1 DUF3326 domain-containing protein [Microcoleus sp. PH2017_10_PVI_O_A]MCC3459982.1 DUF3326 domain-containing protein [Microcoleus sp. PH2017_11_PCY_U_A]MCC3478496.1 DUF3326 domain-containing protein [Microcoleus sp. PH2017_12_PCY_D_A]MCC3527956.1 DUF3326 domain-containing protein [Microcoleus sp. PH2017_21_RUC_O_A]
MNPRPLTVVLIVPTGVGASIGGFAGDALPVARAIAQISDTLITHPNVLNGAQLYWPIPNALYVEGYALDKFAAGCWGLQPVHQNRIGLIMDCAIEPELQLRHLQAVDAARATLGLKVTDCILTDRPLQVELRISESGASWGTIGNPDSLLRAADKLIAQAKVQAIAVVARFPDDEGSIALENYRRGKGVDPLAGAEAVISHLIVRTFKIPCAHAPALSALPLDPHLSPRSAAEEIGYTFLPCVLAGLSKAPQFVTPAVGEASCLPQVLGGQDARTTKALGGQDAHPTRENFHANRRDFESQGLWADRVDAVVVPATACGGSAILSLSGRSTVQIIAVGDNKTQMQASPEKLGIKALQVNSYLEAIGVLVALRAGISPASLGADISSLRCLSDSIKQI